ncbi:fimbrial protein [Scandinavium sp.]|uniref:fimbrial protein n=1 Tax=Scandinavium sp. TaxID=2830653 RepID=UPI00289D2290|nr:fimbrial protein [Scandinavium sp.]
MNVKAKYLAVAISALIVTSSAMAASQGESSTVKFTGSISEPTCTLSDASKDQTVPLGDVQTTAFSGAGSTASAGDINIDLENCSIKTLKTATVTFKGDTANDTALKTTAVDTTKVGIQILENGQPMKLDGSQPSGTQDLVEEGATSFKFSARYVALDEAVAAGDAGGVANFTVNYQ